MVKLGAVWIRRVSGHQSGAIRVTFAAITGSAREVESARKLRPVERLKRIDALMDSLDEPDPVIEAAWAAEAQDRLAAYQRGELPTAPIEELFAKLREQ